MLTATGIGSGLDIEGLVTQLVAAERAPTDNRLLSRETTLTTELSAFGTLQGALGDFQTSLAALNTVANFGKRTATSSDSKILSATASADAEPGSYEFSVTQLAKSHSLATGSYTSATSVVGTGTITFRFGTTDYTAPDPTADPPVVESYNSFTVNPDRGTAVLTITSANNTLEGVRDAINEADIGVSAVIVNDGTGFRLLISSDQTGAKNSLEISVDDDDTNDTDSSGLSTLAFNSSATNLTQTAAAQDANFTVNGLSISSSDNSADTVISGTTITLQDITGTTPVKLTIAKDRDSITEAIDAFISGYNSLVGTINELTAFDSESLQAGLLQGDFSARSIASQLRQALSESVEGYSGSINNLSEIGITTTADGTLSLNSDTLDKVLDTNFDDIASLFAAVGRPTDANIKFLASTDKTVVGNYGVQITQLATQGVLNGSTNSSLVIDGNNDTFSVKVNNITSSNITLTQATYASESALAAELQSRINGDTALKNAGVAVTVSYDSTNDRFDITSNRYGSESTVEILSVDTNTTATIGLSVGAGTAGLDVAGTIGGASATGTGQVLTGADGSDTEGLQIEIKGSTTGARGAVEYSQGVAYQVDSLLTQFLGTDGVLGSRTSGIQAQIADIEDDREALNLRMEAVEARIRAQFNALDGLLAQLQSTSNFLTQQLANLPSPGALVNTNNN